MSDGRAELEELAERIRADARERAAAIARYPGAAVNVLRHAERKAQRVLAGPPGTSAACCSPAAVDTRPRASNASRDLRDLDGNPRPTKRRACLRCRGDFDSVGPGNRLCDPCRSRDLSPYAV